MNEGYSPLQSLSAMIVSSSFGNSYFLRGPAGLCVCVRLEKDRRTGPQDLLFHLSQMNDPIWGIYRPGYVYNHDQVPLALCPS
jgi:hypothetical protein